MGKQVRRNGKGAVATRTTPRVIRRSAQSDIPRYFTRPKWGAHTTRLGGTSMQVRLGPAASRSTNYGSTPRKNTPTVMSRLKRMYPFLYFKAGHLLNDNLGGAGEAHNLVPIPGKMNRRHATIERKIVQGLDLAFSNAENNPNAEYHYGIDYKVIFKARKSNTNPDAGFLKSQLVIKATPIQVDKKTGIASQSAEAQRIMGFKPIDIKITSR